MRGLTVALTVVTLILLGAGAGHAQVDRVLAPPVWT